MKESRLFEDPTTGKWLTLEEETFFTEGTPLGCPCRLTGWLVADGRASNVRERHRSDDWNEPDAVGTSSTGRMEFGRDINSFQSTRGLSRSKSSPPKHSSVS